MTTLPAASVVFACCNHAPTLRALFDALDATDWPDLRIVAVDCGSSDGSLRQLRERAARTTGVPMQLIEMPGAGRATALNAGIAAAGDRDVVRLHADCVPDSPDWLRTLHAVLVAHPDCGIVGGKIVLAGGRIQTCGRNLINGIGIRPEWSDRRWLEGDRDDASRPTEVDGVSGELCWYRRAMLEQTGGLDTNYDPVFGCDDDLCLLARWHGWSVYVEPAVRGVHYAPRRSTTTNPGLPDHSGHLQRMLDDRDVLVLAHRDYFHAKWGFDPTAPDLGEIRRRYGHTRICWQIGDRLREDLPAEPAVDVCLVTWNSMHLLPRAMEHLAQTRWAKVAVWITDNGSTDGTVEYLEGLAASFPFPIHVERLTQNIGVAPALNAAFVRGTAPIVARLDDDTYVSPEWLERLIPRFHQRPYAGMVGPQVLQDNEGSTLQSGPNREWPHGFPGIGPDGAAMTKGLSRVITIRGCCNLYRRSVFAKVGLLDVRFAPSQFDEWDHHIAMAVAGYEIIYDGSVAVRHLLTAGRMATPASMGNFRANLAKSNTKWGGEHWLALDRAIDLSIEGRFLPPDGDTSELLRALPPVPDSPPVPVARDPQQIRELSATARRRSLLRSLQGPLQAYWNHQVQLGLDCLTQQPRVAGAIVTKVMDLLPQDPLSLMFLAKYRILDGEHRQAAVTARWALRLAPDNERLREMHDRLFEPTVELPRASIDAMSARTARADAPRILLIPPLEPADEVAHHAAALTAQALRRAGAVCDLEHRLVPDPRGYDAVHAFALGDPSTLVGRLQVVRAMAPGVRIVVSPLNPDPAAANWTGHVVGARYHSGESALRQVMRAVVEGKLNLDGNTSRRVPGDAHPHLLAYERRCFDFIDALIVHTVGESEWLRSRHTDLPAIALLPEGVPGPELGVADDGALLPRGGVIFVGPRDLPGNHTSMVLALRGGPLPFTLCGRAGHPYGFQLSRPGGNVHFLPPLSLAELAAAFRRSAVHLWLPSGTASFALPLQAAASGCELVIARDVGAEQYFGDHATYVDPCDLDAIRSAVAVAAARWRGDPDEPWRQELRRVHDQVSFAQRLLTIYGLPSAAPRPDRELQGV